MADAPWQVALLGAIVLIDVIVFIGLCRDEIADSRGARRTRRERRISPHHPDAR